ncbi:hypothetical protein Enr13x_32450 [Stieleria neptunia]|uniref:Uncharacterized protein n=2 Tax=Stieleria neptunia TaxID=2527979 RepID=A0A518HRB4_9BACT|nr:hypothetical protein Enr13x_32450 [Stieleria neptunia]
MVLLGAYPRYLSPKSEMKNNGLTRYFAKPGNTAEEYRRASLDMFSVITGREPTPHEISDLNAAFGRSKRENVADKLEEKLGRPATQQEINLYIAQADSLGDY